MSVNNSIIPKRKLNKFIFCVSFKNKNFCKFVIIIISLKNTDYILKYKFVNLVL